jgi:hypothetical protein
MTTKELKASRSLKFNKGTRILQADKGNCIVGFDESKCKGKLNILLESGVYKPLPKDSTAKVERKIKNSFPNTKLLSLLI